MSLCWALHTLIGTFGYWMCNIVRVVLLPPFLIVGLDNQHLISCRPQFLLTVSIKAIGGGGYYGIFAFTQAGNGWIKNLLIFWFLCFGLLSFVIWLSLHTLDKCGIFLVMYNWTLICTLNVIDLNVNVENKLSFGLFSIQMAISVIFIWQLCPT